MGSTQGGTSAPVMTVLEITSPGYYFRILQVMIQCYPDSMTKSSRNSSSVSFSTASGIPLSASYSEVDREKVGLYPYSRGIHENMYRGRLWTMRQYAGFGTAQETNERYHYLIAQGVTGLSVAFDLPTQMGIDADSNRAVGEVGRVGVSISTLDDMRALLHDIPLSTVSVSMTINSTAAILLAMYLVVAREQGVAWSSLRGTIQNDCLKEYMARGTYIYPPEAAMRLTTDIFTFCGNHVPSWNTISISGYHIREAGASAVQELGLTFANAICYVEAALKAGLAIDDFAPRLAFFFNCQLDFFEEIAKFRAARRIWAKLMKERFLAQDDRSLKLRFHTQTAGSSLTAQQPENNIIRTTLEALAAVLGGTQSLHTNGYDEALGLPTEGSARLALRTQQIIANETGVPHVADPLGGSYYIETLTDTLETEAFSIIDMIEREGGMLTALENNIPQSEIERSAYEWQQKVESGERSIVGVNAFVDSDESAEVAGQTLNPDSEKTQRECVTAYKTRRKMSSVNKALRMLEASARTSGTSLMEQIIFSLEAGATLGEISDVFRTVFGEYRGIR